MPTSLFTDVFTNTNATALTSHNAGYVNAKGALQIQSNGVAPNLATGDGEIGVAYTGVVFNASHYSAIKVAALGAQEIGPATAVGGAGSGNYYGLYWDNAALYRFKNVASAWTHVGSDLTVPSVNDIITLERDDVAKGLTSKVNGVVTGGVQTDSSVPSGGSPGICGWGSGSATRGDNLDLGNMADFPPVPRMSPLSPALLCR